MSSNAKDRREKTQDIRSKIKNGTRTSIHRKTKQTTAFPRAPSFPLTEQHEEQRPPMVKLSYRGRSKDSEKPSTHFSASDSAYKPRRTRGEGMSLKRLLTSTRWPAVAVSLLCWLCVVNFYERSTVRRTIQRCQWDRWEVWQRGEPHRVALFADPQIMDAYSYPGRPALVNWFARQLIDNYHRRNYEYVMSVLDPDTTVFLGDLFDGGRNWDDNDWFEEFSRFNDIYYKRPNRRTIMSLPGNHDIGFGDTVNVTSLERFRAIFGPTSSTHDVGNHTLVLLDTISLSDNSNVNVTKDPREVLERLSPWSIDEKPRILMSHVPLYRFPDKQTCGPLRESKNRFPIMKGDQYQTVIDYELSQEVLTKVRPQIAFSGDDHDYCHVTHPYKSQGKDRFSDEITVKSCSMNMGVQYPAIQLLSLNTFESAESSYNTQICYLPPPYTALKGYICAAIVNVIAFLVIFMLPQIWESLTQRVTAKINSVLHRYEIPIAQQTKSIPVALDKDFVGFVTTGSIVVVGVLTIFSIYFNAF